MTAPQGRETTMRDLDKARLNICMFGHKRVPSREGGIEVVVEALAARMVQAGHRVTCLNRGGHHVSGAEFDAAAGRMYRGIRLKTVPTIDKKGLAAVSSSVFAALCSALGKYDVVHIHAEGPALFCWLPRLLGKKVVVTVHGLDWQREKWKHGLGAAYIGLAEKAAVRWADEIIVLSRNVQRYFETAYGRRTWFIPNGITRPVPAPPDQIGKLYGLEKDGYILYLSRIVPEKGEHYLIEAFRRIETDKKLVIAGGVSDSSDYAQRLREMAAGDGRILFTGFVQGQVLEELYSNAYLYCLPSDLEGMPLSLLEAMSYGNCCLTSDIPECVEVIEDKGLTFPQGDVEGLREKLAYLLAHRETVEACRREAADHICRKYDWDEVVKETLEIYRRPRG